MLIIHLKDIIEIQAEELLEESHIPLLSASKIASGTFREERIPAGIARTREVIALIQNALDGEIDLNHTHPDATETASGFMSAADKATLDSLSASPVTESQIITLAAAISGKAPSVHQHEISDITGLQSAIEGAGGGTIADVTGLQDALDGKAAIGHTHSGFLVENLNPQLLTYTISQSSVDGTAQAGTYENLTDGSLTSGTGTSNGSFEWIKADFGQSKTFNRLLLAGGSTSWDANIALYLDGSEVELSLDGSLWMEFLPPVSKVTNTGSRWYAFSLITARYVRLRKSGSSYPGGSYLGVCEFKIYG